MNLGEIKTVIPLTLAVIGAIGLVTYIAVNKIKETFYRGVAEASYYIQEGKEICRVTNIYEAVKIMRRLGLNEFYLREYGDEHVNAFVVYNGKVIDIDVTDPEYLTEKPTAVYRCFLTKLDGTDAIMCRKII